MRIICHKSVMILQQNSYSRALWSQRGARGSVPAFLKETGFFKDGA